MIQTKWKRPVNGLPIILCAAEATLLPRCEWGVSNRMPDLTRAIDSVRKTGSGTRTLNESIMVYRVQASALVSFSKNKMSDPIMRATYGFQFTGFPDGVFADRRGFVLFDTVHPVEEYGAADRQPVFLRLGRTKVCFSDDVIYPYKLFRRDRHSSC